MTKIPRNVQHQLKLRTQENLVGTCHKCLLPIWAWNIHLRDDQHNTIEHLGCSSNEDRQKVRNFLDMIREAKIGEARYREYLRKEGKLLGPDGEPVKPEN